MNTFPFDFQPYTQLSFMLQSNISQNNPIHQLEARIQELQIQNNFLKRKVATLKRIIRKQNKRKRRSLQDIEKQFNCPYDRCKRIYASELALNLHMNKKHNGGTKTQRQILAIVLAQEKGEQMPIVTINFPPGFLEKFKSQFFK